MTRMIRKTTHMMAAEREADKIGAILLACIPFPNKGDAHLSKVLCHTAENEYTVWTFNVQDGGFHGGYYYKELISAMHELTSSLMKLGFD